MAVRTEDKFERMDGLVISKCTNAGILAKLNKRVQDLHHELYLDEFKAYNYTEVRKAFTEMLEDPGNIALVARVNDELAGYVFCMVKNRTENAFQPAYSWLLLDQISVESAFEGRGIAQALLSEVKEFARTQKLREIRVSHWSINQHAAAFFSRNGFSEFMLSKRMILE